MTIVPSRSPGSTAAPSSSRRILLAALAIIVVALFSQTLTYDFVTYDDYSLIVHNEEYLADWSNVASAFGTHAFASQNTESVYYRPVLLVTYIIDYHLWKLRPFGFHLFNLIIHTTVCLLVFLLLDHLIAFPMIALAGALIFAAHPVQVEAVAWISGRNDLLLGAFIVAMVFSYAKFRTSARPVWFFLSLASYAAALFTKESGAFYLLLLPLYDVAFGDDSLRSTALRQRVKYWLAFAIVLFLYLLVRISVFGEVIGAEKLYGSETFASRLLQVPMVVAEYLRLLFVPTKLTISHLMSELMWRRMPWNAVAVALLPVLAILSVIAWRKDRIIAFGLSWLFVGLLPALNVIPVAVIILEHRLYVPLVGLAIVLARIVCLNAYFERYRLVVRGLVVLLVVLFAILSLRQMPVWKDSVALWTDTMKKSPSDTRAYFNLAGYYFEKQKYDETIDLLKKYLERKPKDYLGHEKLRQTYSITGRYRDAIDVSMRMINLDPKNPARYLEAGTLLLQFQQVGMAVKLYEEGIKEIPNSHELHFNLGFTYERLGQIEKIEPLYKRAIELNPQYALPYFGLGNLLARRQEDNAAIRLLERGAALQDPPANIGQLMHYLYMKTGQTEKAELVARRYGF